MFDDGSRIIKETTTSTSSNESPSSIQSSRGNVSLEVYYEVDRVAKEVVEKLDWSENTVRGQLIQQIESIVEDTETSKSKKNNNKSNKVEDDGFLCRIALQFPDELLADAPDVSWLMEDAISNAYRDKLLLLQSQSTLQHTKLENKELSTDSTQHQSSSQQQQELINKHLQQLPLIFILGDTTYGSCCPDEISANHLNANIIVHYGYGCLSPTEVLPVVYAFGVCNFGNSINGGGGEGNKVWKECVQMVLSATNEANSETRDGEKRKLLILYEVKYHHAINELKLQFDEEISNGDQKFQEVILGMIPKQQLNSESSRQLDEMQNRGGCCGGEDKANDDGCCSSTDQTAACCNSPTVEYASEEPTSAQPSNSCCDVKDTPCCNQANQDDTEQQKEITPIVEQQQYIPRTIGGLEIPNDLDLTECTLLYIGDDLNIDSSEKNAHTRLLHILLRCSAPDGPQAVWSYSPIQHQLNTDVLNSPISSTNDTSLSTILSRTLRRRFFLLNKTKLANTIAILIGTTSNSYSFRRLLARTRHRIQSSGRTAYTFAVGKLSTAPNKLANFAEIDAFVLIACGESIASFWQMEREEMLVPVLTPLELDVALGYREWDGRYSCDFGDLIRWDEEDGIVDESLLQQEGGQQQGNIDHHKELNNTGSDSDSDDEPFFSMISGKYEQSRSSAKQKNDLEALPGQGKLIEYKSEAAEFLKQREYRGLEANVGETEVKAAVKGLVGIASNYGEKLSKDT